MFIFLMKLNVQIFNLYIHVHVLNYQKKKKNLSENKYIMIFTVIKLELQCMSSMTLQFIKLH